MSAKKTKSKTNAKTTERTNVTSPRLLDTGISVEASVKEDDRTVSSLPSGASSAVEKNIPQPTLSASVNASTLAEPAVAVKGTKDVLIAYVHNLSPTKRNKKDTLDYCKLQLQTKDEPLKEALLYSKSKRKILSDSEKSHTPIKIQRYTCTADGKKVIINDVSNISAPNQTEYSFQYKKSPSASAPVHSVAEITADCNEWDQVAVRGKIVHIGDVEVVGKNSLKLAKATLADQSGTIQLDVWEDSIEQIETGRVYEISPLQVRVWTRTKKLATTYSSVFSEIEDETLSIIEVTEKQIRSKTDEVTVTVEDVETVQKIEKFISCCNPSCSKRILQDTSAAVVHCDRCGHTMRSAKCKSHLCVKLILSVKEENIYLAVFEDQLKTVIGGDLTTYTEVELAEMLLLLKDITITYDGTTKVVKQIRST